MDKIELIQEYIDRCDIIIESNNTIEAKNMSNEIIGVFSKEIENITKNLSNYTGLINSVINYVEDIKLLKQKLINYMSTINEEYTKREHELELARLKQPHFTAHAESNPVQNQNIAITVTLEQTINNLDDIPESNLASSDKETLKELLYSLEGIKVTKDKDKFWNKAKEILGFLANKSADAAITVLPLIMSGLS